jgi:hypothetical protein
MDERDLIHDWNTVEGAFDYDRFLRSVMTGHRLSWSNLDASLEWFGPEVLSTLEHDSNQLLQRASALPPKQRLTASHA